MLHLSFWARGIAITSAMQNSAETLAMLRSAEIHSSFRGTAITSAMQNSAETPAMLRDAEVHSFLSATVQEIAITFAI
jgi:hypothetical protein